VLVAAGAFGVVGQVLFFGVGLGINFPIAVALLLAGGWLVGRRRTGLRPWDTWLAPAALAFASFAALRADPTIVALDVLTAIALTFGALASFGERSVVARPFWSLPGLGVGLAAWVAGGALLVVASARRHLPSLGTLSRHVAGSAPVVRGLVIAIPVAVVFVALFSAADAVFARLVDNMVGIQIDLGDTGWRVALAAVLAWLAAGALGIAGSEPPSATADVTPQVGRIGATELVTILVVVNGIFAVFVALQAAYLFGGLDTLAASGLTYADYARRGFAELVVVAMLAGSLIIGADRLVARRSSAVLTWAVLLAVLTGVVIVSAALRLMLYQDAYGWTELRLYVLATIAWLAIGTVGLVVALVIDRVRWIGHARFITEQNVARLIDPSLVPPNGQTGLDTSYVLRLGDDAIPALVMALPVLAGHAADELAASLSDRLDELRTDSGLNAWQAWNAGRAAARAALEAAEARGELR
jgi:hypothetical protein